MRTTVLSSRRQFRTPVRLTVLAVVAVATLPLALLLPAGTPPAGATAACGGVVLTGSFGRARPCTFDEEFTGASLDRSTWIVQTTAQRGFHSGAECLLDTPQTVSVSGGHLNLTVRRTGPFTCRSPKGSYRASWVGGSVYTRAFDQLYGRFEVRARFPEAWGRRGLQGALWMFPREVTLSNATSGPTEIDIAEAYSRYRDWIAPAEHAYLSGRSVSCQVPDYGAAFHVYAVDWTRRAAIFTIDGKTCMRVLGTGTRAPFLLALSQVLGVTTNLPTSATPGTATTQVDYVRVWA